MFKQKLKLLLKAIGLTLPTIIIAYIVNSIFYAIIYKLIINYDINAFNKKLTWGDAFMLAFTEPITTFYPLPIKHTKLYFKIISMIRTITFYSILFGYGTYIKIAMNMAIKNLTPF